MLESLLAPNHWHWILLGVVFVTCEAFVPGAFFLGMGISAALVGASLWLVPGLDWKLQLLGFAALSVVFIVAARRWLKTQPIESDQPLLNLRGAQYVGRSFHLDEPIVNNQGKIRVDDSTWKVRGPDCPAGTRVRVSGVEGTVLRVDVAEEVLP